MKAHARPLVTCLACAAVLASCTGIDWPYKLVEDTPVRSIERPDNYIRGGFGRIVVSVRLPARGGEPGASYAATSAGGDSPTAIYLLAEGDDIGGGLIYSYASAVRNEPFIGYFTGAALASVDVWRYMGEDLGCVIVGEPGYEGSAGGFTRYCMDAEDATNPRRVEGTGLLTQARRPARNAGRSLAVLPDPASPEELGYLAVGAVGSVHLVNASLARAIAPSLEPPTGLEADDFGVSVAAGLTGPDWPGWVAVGSNGRVYVFGVWDDPTTDTDDPDHAWLQACYESAGRPGFGTLVWSADVDGDGRTDLAIGAHPDEEGRAEDVVLVGGTAFHDGAPPDPYPTVSCEDVPVSAVFTCPTFAMRSVECGFHPDFGASFAAGDLDGDGSSEVVIGAPSAEVAGKSGAGAVFIYDPSSPAVPVSVLRDATPEKNAHLGTSVAVGDVAGEDEVIVGAPGHDEVLVFFCSGVGTDDASYPGDIRCR